MLDVGCQRRDTRGGEEEADWLVMWPSGRIGQADLEGPDLGANFLSFFILFLHFVSLCSFLV